MLQTQPQVLAPEQPLFVLTPPDVVPLVVATQTQGVVQLNDDLKRKVAAQLEGFMAVLTTQDVNSDEFRTKLDQAFSVGRQEIAEVTSITDSSMKRNFIGETEMGAYKALNELRTLFDDLNPARQGDLFASNKVLGIPIPFGNKLKSYLRRYESTQTHLDALYQHLSDAKLNVEKDVSELGAVRTQMYEGLQKLEAVVFFVSELDKRLSAQIEEVRKADADRARALEQEVLYYVRQNLGDVQATQALTINAYNIFGELRKTGRETMNGCDRVATLGLAALSTAVRMARSTGLQIKVMAMLDGSKKSVEDMIVATGKAMNDHATATADFASNPIIGVQVLQQMFDQTGSAMAIMDNFRTTALTNMQANNQMLQTQLAQQMKRITNDQRLVGAEVQGIAL